jgi:hypothetical protein
MKNRNEIDELLGLKCTCSECKREFWKQPEHAYIVKEVSIVRKVERHERKSFCSYHCYNNYLTRQEIKEINHNPELKELREICKMKKTEMVMER